MISIYLLAIADENFLGIKVVKFNQNDLVEDGYFLFVDSKRWALDIKDKQQIVKSTFKARRTKINVLVHDHILIDVLN